MSQPAQAVVEALTSASVAGAVQQGDTAVVALLHRQRRLPGELFLELMGGVAGLEARFPQSAVEILRRITDRYGAPALSRLRAADGRVQQAVADARAVRGLLRRARDTSGRGPVSRAVLDRHIDEHALNYADVLAALALGETGLPAHTTDDFDPPPSSLAALGEMLWDHAFSSPPDRAAALVHDADLEQDLTDSRVAVGEQLLGRVMANRAGGDDIVADAILPPLAGCPDRDLALAQARLTGAATAIVDTGSPPLVESTFYLCRLSENLSYDDVVSFQGPGTELQTLHADDRVIALTTSGGQVLRPGPNGRYFVVDQVPADPAGRLPIADPGAALRADLELARIQAEGSDPRTADLLQPDPPLGALFRQAVLDYTQVSLARTERRLREQGLRFVPQPLTINPDAGAGLRAKTAELATAMYESALLAWGMRDDHEPTEAESVAAQKWTAKIGEILSAEPLAMVFIKSDTEEDEEPRPGWFADELATAMDGDAALAAAKAVNDRLDNISELRRRLCTDPEAAGRLAALHPSVLEFFTPDQRMALDILFVLDLISGIATACGMVLRDLLLVVLAFAEGPVGLLAAGISAGLGLSAVGEGFEQAELLTVMARLDVPGGFQLATDDDAASARRWAWIGYGLALLDISDVGVRTSRYLRRAVTGLAETSPLASAMNETVALHRLAVPGGMAATAAAVTAAGQAVTTGTKAVSALQSAAELANWQRLSSQAFRELSSELRISQRRLRALLISAVDEAQRLEAVAALRQAAAQLVKGGSARKKPLKAVLRPAVAATKAKAFRGTREYLVIGSADAEIGWGVEQLKAGRRTTAVAPARTPGTDVFVAQNGQFVQGTLGNLPAGYQCNIAREEMLNPGAVADAQAFITQRLDRLRQGGQWVITTESQALVQQVSGVASRPGARIWTTEYTTFRNGRQVTRHVIVIAKPRPTTMTALARLTTPPGSEARVAKFLQQVRSPANADLLRRKLAHTWHRGIIEEGQVAEGLLKNLTGNIGEILAGEYKATVLAGRRASPGKADSRLATGIRRVHKGTDQSTEFTDDLIGLERNGNFVVSDVFEVKAGPRGGQEAQTQIFEWIENELDVGDRIVINGKEYVYNPEGTGPGRIIDLVRSRKHIVVAKGAERAGLRSADQTAAPVVRQTLDATAAEIRAVAREILLNLPPAP